MLQIPKQRLFPFQEAHRKKVRKASYPCLFKIAHLGVAVMDPPYGGSALTAPPRCRRVTNITIGGKNTP
jgi:hypothetical protein